MALPDVPGLAPQPGQHQRFPKIAPGFSKGIAQVDPAPAGVLGQGDTEMVTPHGEGEDEEETSPK